MEEYLHSYLRSLDGKFVAIRGTLSGVRRGRAGTFRLIGEKEGKIFILIGDNLYTLDKVEEIEVRGE